VDGNYSQTKVLPVITYREILSEDAAMLLRWRNTPRVAAGFSGTLPPDVDRQKRWIESSRLAEDSYHWITVSDNHDFGYVRFHHWNKEERSCRLGFYVGEEAFALCYVTVLDDLLSFLFYRLGLDYVVSYVLTDNRHSNRFNVAYGFTRRPDMDDVATQSAGKATFAYTLSREDWIRLRHIMECEADFPVTFWSASPY